MTLFLVDPADSSGARSGQATALSPFDRVSGVVFGLIMALTFTGSLSVATADRNEVRTILIGALGCNIAWGMVDAVMFVTAEYNRSIPGVLKNALDHASRPYGQSAWAGKPAGIIGASIGAISTAVAQLHLRTILAYLDMPTLGQPEAYLQIKDGFFDEAGNIASPDTRKFLHGWMDKYVAWVKKFTG